MRIRLTKNEILVLAGRYLDLPSYEVGVSNGAADERIERTLQAARDRGHMTSDELRATARWKYPGNRLVSLVAENTPDEIAEITRVSFAATSERLRIGALLALHGIGWPMASVILHFAFPGRYPILDVRVMHTIDGPRVYNFDGWTRITKFCRNKSAEYGVTMRELDRALWTHDYELSRQT